MFFRLPITNSYDSILPWTNLYSVFFNNFVFFGCKIIIVTIIAYNLPHFIYIIKLYELWTCYNIESNDWWISWFISIKVESLINTN
jgi:hypothetical protein